MAIKTRDNLLKRRSQQLYVAVPTVQIKQQRRKSAPMLFLGFFVLFVFFLLFMPWRHQAELQQQQMQQRQSTTQSRSDMPSHQADTIETFRNTQYTTADATATKKMEQGPSLVVKKAQTMPTTTTTTMIMTEETRRSNILQLLQALPDNTTQREVSNATIRTFQGGRITLCTQGGVSKLDRLVDLAGRWLGPISCAIYITTEEQLDSWLDFMYQPQHAQLMATYVSFHVLMEQPQMPKTVNRHPINKLRNLALRNAETSHVFLNDIDFIPPANAHDLFLRPPDDFHPPLPPPMMFWVLPAFERFGIKPKGPESVVTNVSWIPDCKAALLQALQQSNATTNSQPIISPFHPYFPAGHKPCNYTHWYTATTIYNISYDYLFEPYVIVHKRNLPQFFPTFRGFAFNKMSFFMEAHYMGFQYQVHPHAFVVHMNHGGRKGRNDKGGDSKYIKEDFRKYLVDKYHVSQRELKKWK